MKIKIAFNSRDEFIAFLMNVSSISIHSYGKEVESLYDSLEKITEISVGDVDFYSVNRINPRSRASSSFTLINFMVNQTQRELEPVFITEPETVDTFVAAGITDVTKYLYANVSRPFILRVGWRTDYCDFLFQPN